MNFKIINDHTVIANIAGEEKLPDPFKEEIRGMLHQFSIGNY